MLRNKPQLPHRLPQAGGGRPIGKPRDFRENLGMEPLIRRTINENYRDWNGGLRNWNGGNGGGGQDIRPAGTTPPPPANLDWNSPSPRRNESPMGLGRRDMSPVDNPKPTTNIMGYRNYDYSQNMPYSQNMGGEPNQYMPNDNMDVVRIYSQEPPQHFRNPMSSMPPEPYSGNKQNFDGSRDQSFGFHSFDEYRRSDSGFESRNGYSNENFNQSVEKDYGNWQSFGSGNDVAMGRKREGEPLVPVGPPPRKRVRPEVSDQVFLIGGYKLPYVTLSNEALPQPENRSYAVKFFKRMPNYRIHPKTKDKNVYQVYDEMLDPFDFGNEEGAGRPSAISQAFNPARFRDNLSKEWTKIYRGRNYRSWEGWWKDFRNIDVDIFAQLDKFEDFNVKYNFLPPEGPFDITEILKNISIALTKNRNNYSGNMRQIYSVMNHGILSNLPMEAVGQLQDSIRSVPNHLWVYKMRSMIYTWYNYSQVIQNNKDPNEKKFQFVNKEWQSPVIHWMAKQAFFELKAISKIEYPDYKVVYGKCNKSAKK
ncbi:hypothetical protein KR067_005477 [Drosophila pandora]|nr:hypothetical protein KR067_005477 [Drosophila pandora]